MGRIPRKAIVILYFLYVVMAFQLSCVPTIKLFLVLKSLFRTCNYKPYLISTTGCAIPNTNFCYTDRKNGIVTPEPNFCRLPLIYSNLTHLYIDEKALKQYLPDLTNVTKFQCFYTPFWRIDSEDNVQFGESQPFNDSIKVKEEFVMVECKNNNNTFHKDFHAFIPAKPNISKVEIKFVDSNILSVIILGIQSLSRLKFNINMPKTIKYLKGMDPIEFYGFSEVKDSYSDLLALLTGYNIDQLKNCWLTEITFNHCRYIFEKYRKKNYITNFAENTRFDFNQKIWKEQAADYYWKPFNLVTENNSNENTSCKKPSYKALLEYGQRFITSQKQNTFISFLWLNNLVKHKNTYSSSNDDDYLKFLQILNNSNVLNKSVLIFLSDVHENEVKSGRIEEILPVLYIKLPPWFKHHYPLAFENMEKNSRRLTTVFDVHATLNHILHPNLFGNNYIKKSSYVDKKHYRGISLFHLIPGERTCASADISKRSCPCGSLVNYMQLKAHFDPEKYYEY